MKLFNEGFISENENNESVKNVFTIIGFALLGMLISTVLMWSYALSDRNQYMFIVVLSVIIMVYCIVMISVSVINKSSYDYATYNVLLGFSIFMIFLSFGLVVFFLLKYFNIFSFGMGQYDRYNY
jgi:hypothetical protein